MYDPGLDRHEWQSEFEALEPELAESPAESLPEFDALVARMLEETGFAIDDPVAGKGDDPEIIAEFRAAREITQASERGSEELSPGDVAAAINGYRAVFDYLVATRSAADADLEAAEETEE